MKKTKEEVIKDVVGENLTKYCDENGWFDFIPKGFTLYDCDKKGLTKYRPKSLQGIENNNGWIKIENEADLSNSSMYCWAIDEKGNIRKDLHYNYVYKVFQETFPYIKNVKVTHYQPIIKPKTPLY